MLCRYLPYSVNQPEVRIYPLPLEPLCHPTPLGLLEAVLDSAIVVRSLVMASLRFFIFSFEENL